METLKSYFVDYLAAAKRYCVVIALVAIVLNLFVSFGVGFLFAIALIGFILHSLYARFGR